MSFKYEDEYLPLERNLERQHKVENVLNNPNDRSRYQNGGNSRNKNKNGHRKNEF